MKGSVVALVAEELFERGAEIVGRRDLRLGATVELGFEELDVHPELLVVVGDLFLVYNHNLRHDIDPTTGQPVDAALQTDPTRRGPQRWSFGSNQLLVKMQYAFRY